jgi:hypothetical protein
MSDETRTETAPEPATIDPAIDRARMRTVAALHFVMAMGALTLWGAADAWAVASGWGLAQAAAIANAIIAATIITSILHEWGHFAGARLSGSVAPVLEKPVRYFFMFDFKFEHNDPRQFLWMSAGGILTPWLLVLATPLLVPIDSASRAMLLAAFVTRAVQVSVFEVPVFLRTQGGGQPRDELGRQIKSGFATSRYTGIAVGALVWLAA